MSLDHHFIQRARAAVHKAERDLACVTRSRFPAGTPVRVDHHRGTFYGVVLGVERDGVRLRVQDATTLNVTVQDYENLTRL